MSWSVVAIVREGENEGDREKRDYLITFALVFTYNKTARRQTQMLENKTSKKKISWLVLTVYLPIKDYDIIYVET